MGRSGAPSRAWAARRASSSGDRWDALRRSAVAPASASSRAFVKEAGPRVAMISKTAFKGAFQEAGGPSQRPGPPMRQRSLRGPALRNEQDPEGG